MEGPGRWRADTTWERAREKVLKSRLNPVYSVLCGHGDPNCCFEGGGDAPEDVLGGKIHDSTDKMIAVFATLSVDATGNRVLKSEAPDFYVLAY